MLSAVQVRERSELEVKCGKVGCFETDMDDTQSHRDFMHEITDRRSDDAMSGHLPGTTTAYRVLNRREAEGCVLPPSCALLTVSP